MLNPKGDYRMACRQSERDEKKPLEDPRGYCGRGDEARRRGGACSGLGHGGRNQRKALHKKSLEIHEERIGRAGVRAQGPA